MTTTNSRFSRARDSLLVTGSPEPRPPSCRLKDTPWTRTLHRTVLLGGLVLLCAIPSADTEAKRPSQVGSNISIFGTPYPIFEPLAPRPFFKKRVKKKRTHSRTLQGYGKSIEQGRHSLVGFPKPLIAKVAEIKKFCSARVVSAYRPGARIRYTGRVSNHALKKAVDVKGNSKCIYTRLKKWPDGYSIDAYIGHIHISYNRAKEWGARFAHYGRQTRFAYGGRR